VTRTPRCRRRFEIGRDLCSSTGIYGGIQAEARESSRNYRRYCSVKLLGKRKRKFSLLIRSELRRADGSRGETRTRAHARARTLEFVLTRRPSEFLPFRRCDACLISVRRASYRRGRSREIAESRDRDCFTHGTGARTRVSMVGQ